MEESRTTQTTLNEKGMAELFNEYASIENIDGTKEEDNVQDKNE